MATSYPAGLDSFTNPTASDELDDEVGTRTHSEFHADNNDAIEAIQTELGTDPSGASATVKARIEAVETTAGTHATRHAGVGADPITSLGAFSGTGAAAFQTTGKTGSIGIEAAGTGGVSSFIGQQSAANGEMQLRVSRAGADPEGATHFLITPFTYGMSIEYPGNLEIWSKKLFIHPNPTTGSPAPIVDMWVCNSNDSGGLTISSKLGNATEAEMDVRLTCQTFAGGVHGPFRLIQRNVNDSDRGGWLFESGAVASETVKARITSLGAIGTRQTTSPAAGDVATSEGLMWWSDTVGKIGPRWTGKDSAGNTYTLPTFENGNFRIPNAAYLLFSETGGGNGFLMGVDGSNDFVMQQGSNRPIYIRSGFSSNANNKVSFQTDGANERAKITSAGLTMTDAMNIVAGTTTGSKIGTGATQKLGFWNATPVVQPTAVIDATDAPSVITQLNALLARMRTIGLIAT